MKIMAGMDIAEKRLPQDGRIRVQSDNGRDIDFRASTLRTLHGEKIVLRMLNHDKGVPQLEDLGFCGRARSHDLQAVPQAPARRHPRRRPDRQRQDDHALLGAHLDPVRAHQHHHHRRSDRVPAARHQPDADPRQDQADVRRGAALDPAPGSRRHPRRRDPRSGDGADRAAGGADRPPRALDAPHR